MNKKQRGFFLTIDGLIALTMLLVALILISNQTFQPQTPRGIYLKQVSTDVLTVLQTSGRTETSLSGNTTAVREVFEALPITICMQVNLENTVNGTTITIPRPGCRGYGNQLQTVYRTFVYGNTQYIARLESWDNR